MENLKSKLNELQFNYSDMAVAIIDTILYDLEKYPGEVNIQTAIWEGVDHHLIYYRDAWNYLMDGMITDFKEAMDYAGATTVTQIAAHFLTDEVYELANAIGLEY